MPDEKFEWRYRDLVGRGWVFACPHTDSFSAFCINRQEHALLAMHTAAFRSVGAQSVAHGPSEISSRPGVRPGDDAERLKRLQSAVHNAYAYRRRVAAKGAAGGADAPLRAASNRGSSGGYEPAASERGKSGGRERFAV
jgi:hypothetical protein